MAKIIFIVASMAFFFSCAGVSAYQHYNLKPDEVTGKLEGKLVADEPKNDTTLEALCLDPVAGKIKCTVLLLSVYGQMLKDLDTCKVDLDSCQRGCGK